MCNNVPSVRAAGEREGLLSRYIVIESMQVKMEEYMQEGSQSKRRLKKGYEGAPMGISFSLRLMRLF